jgi:chitodextrinase
MKTKRLLLGLLLAGAMTIGLQPLSAKVWYVGTTETWAGKPAADVKATIEEAITAAAAGADVSEIWVAAGTHDITASIALKDKKISFYGGFAGTENAIDERAKPANGKAWEFTNPTVLNSTVTVFSINGPVGAPTVIDGFTMQGPDNNSDVKGVYGNNFGYVTIKNCIVQGFGKAGTTDGGGIDIRGANSSRIVTVEGCLVQNNKGKNGGGIYIAENVNNLIKDCEILNNTTATTGGASNHPATTGDPSASNWGGGVLLNNATIMSCLIAGNTAYAGGGIYVRANTSKIISCIVVNNTATYGGGIGVDKRANTTLIINSTVAGNTAPETGKGAGVFLSDNGQGMYNTILFGNTREAAVENIVAELSDGATKTPTLKNNISDADLSSYGTGNVVATDSALLFAASWVTAATSPGKDAGTVEGLATVPGKDFAGRQRVKGAAIDIGPYEYPDPPAAPTELTLLPSSTNIMVRWTASTTSGVTSYNVYLNSAKHNSAPVTVTEYDVTGLSKGATYTIEVEAIDVDSIASAKLSGTATTLSVDDETPPSQPANLAEVAATKTTITVSYGASTDNIGVLGYRIYANNVEKGATTELRYTITGLAPGTTYDIKVTAYDLAGNESTSGALSVTTIAANRPTVFYVKPSAGSPLWEGKNSYFVKNTLNAAMDAAKALHEICELWVGAGDYLNISLALADSISLYGGFAGTESSLADRAQGSEPWSFLSVSKLSGESPGFSGGSTTNSINSKSVIKQDITAKHPIVVDGFTITNGEHGALLLGGGNTTISRCIIKDNGQQPGGAVGIDGGGVAIRGGGKYRVSYCLIESNKAKSGGGVMLAEASEKAVVEYCTIRNNKALTVNSTYKYGDGNFFHGCGGGVFNQSGVVNSCRISGNEALVGGGIFIRTNAARVSSCILEGNSAIYGGGLGYDRRASNANSNKNIYNCLFANNKVERKLTYVTDDLTLAADSGLGGGVLFTSDEQAIYNSIFVGNISQKADSLSAVGEIDGVRGKLVSCYVDVWADTVGGNEYQTADLYEAATWKPNDGFPGVDKGVAGNPWERDYEGKVRVKGESIDIGPYEKPAVPQPPTHLVMIPDLNEVEISWTPSPDIDVLKYAVYVTQGTTGDAAEEDKITDTVTLTTYTIKGLQENTDYVISVKGIDAVGQYTVPLTSYTTTSHPNTPKRPVIDSVVPDDNQITLTWLSSGDKATHYVIFVNGDSVAGLDTLGSGTLDTTYTVTGLQPYKIYTFAVQAVNRIAELEFRSRVSLPVTVRTTDKVAPSSAPANLAQSDSTRTSVSIAWTAAEDNVGIAFYYIYWDSVLVDSTRSNDPVYARGGLSAKTDTSYSVYVVGVDSVGNTSAASNTITVRTGSKADLPVWYVGRWASKPSNRVFKDFAAAQADINAVTGDTVPAEIWIQAGEYNITTTISLDNRAISYYGGFAGHENSVAERAKVPGGKGWEFVNVSKLIRSAEVDIMKGSNGKKFSITGDVTIDGISFDGKNEGVNKRAIWVANVYLADGTSVLKTYKVRIQRCIVEGFGQEGSGAKDGGTDGAIAIRDCNGEGYIDSCLVQNNKGNVGAGIYVADANSCNIRVVSNCHILNNETGVTIAKSGEGQPDLTTGAPANWAGGVIANIATIRSCYIAGNKAYGGGGVVFRRNGSKLENCIIVNNEASYGGGMLFHQSVTEGLITNNTIAENKASIEGGGIYVDENGQQILNNILWNNTNTTQARVQNVGVMNTKTPKLSNNIVSEIDNYKGTEAIAMSSTVTKDSIFDSEAGFEGWHTKLSDLSIVYDRGTLVVIGYELPTTDYTGAERVIGGRIDIGPFEYQGNTQAPTQPKSLTVTAKDETSISISWIASTMHALSTGTLAGYRVYVNGEVKATVAAPDTAYTITGLSAWTTYTIQVDAYSSDGYISPKTPETFTERTTDETAPSTPINLTATSVGNNEEFGFYIQLGWTLSSDNVGVTGYLIYVNGTYEGTAAANATTYTVGYLTTNTSYTVEVSAIDSAGNESAKASVTATTSGGPNAVDAVSAVSLQVFPNPITNGELVIVNGELKAGEKITIYTADGVAVKRGTISVGEQTLVNVSDLQSGLYVVAAGKKTVKVVIDN